MPNNFTNTFNNELQKYEKYGIHLALVDWHPKIQL